MRSLFILLFTVVNVFATNFGDITSDTDVSTLWVPPSRTLTINGTAFDLSANRSWTVSGSVAWGGITGTLSAQTDLQTALNAKVPTSRSLTIGPTTADLSSDRSFLTSVTNDAQTKAAIVPNTAPSSGQILIGNSGGTAYANQTLSGSGATASLSSSGVLTLSAVANATLSNSSITIAGNSTALGGSVTQDSITGLSTAGTFPVVGLLSHTATANTLSQPSVVMASGTSSSGTPATLVAEINAAANTQLIGWTLLGGATNAANNSIKIIITYADSTTTTASSSASVTVTTMANAGGIVMINGATISAPVAGSSKAVTGIRAETLGAGTGARSAVISALQIAR